MSKHLFLIHSFATYHCALGVIQHNSLDPLSCVMVTYRGFVCAELPAGVTVGALQTIGLPNLNSVRRIVAGRGQFIRQDGEIDHLTGKREFHCYVPHTYFDYAHLIVSHPRCRGFSFIEEGLTSYYRPDEIDGAYPRWRFTWRVRVLRLLLFAGRLPSEVGFFSAGYELAYGFCDESFPGWQRRVVLGTDYLFSARLLSGESRPPLLVFDALVELGRTTVGALTQALASFLADCVRDRVSELHYKLHPSQREESSIAAIREVFNSLNGSIRLQPLAPSVCLEDLFAQFDLKVFVFNSASGLYAALAGREVVSLNPLLEHFDPAYVGSAGNLPSIYHTLVTHYGSHAPEN
jgi:hypothetical protein